MRDNNIFSLLPFLIVYILRENDRSKERESRRVEKIEKDGEAKSVQET